MTKRFKINPNDDAAHNNSDNHDITVGLLL